MGCSWLRDPNVSSRSSSPEPEQVGFNPIVGDFELDDEDDVAAAAIVDDFELDEEDDVTAADYVPINGNMNFMNNDNNDAPPQVPITMPMPVFNNNLTQLLRFTAPIVNNELPTNVWNEPSVYPETLPSTHHYPNPNLSANSMAFTRALAHAVRAAGGTFTSITNSNAGTSTSTANSTTATATTNIASTYIPASSDDNTDIDSEDDYYDSDIEKFPVHHINVPQVKHPERYKFYENAIGAYVFTGSNGGQPLKRRDLSQQSVQEKLIETEPTTTVPPPSVESQFEINPISIWNSLRETELDTETIVSAMAGFSLPASSIPTWASNVPESEWNNMLMDRINRPNPNTNQHQSKHGNSTAFSKTPKH